MITTVTGKNQVTIPAKLAQHLDIHPGTQLDWAIGENGLILVRPLPSRGVLARQLAGIGRDWIAQGNSAVDDLIRQREQDALDEGLAQ